MYTAVSLDAAVFVYRYGNGCETKYGGDFATIEAVVNYIYLRNMFARG